MTTEEIKKHILALEIAALERWNAGDPDGYLAIYADDITYFDPINPARIDGLSAMTELYNRLRGGVKVDRYELIDPQVTVSGTVAVLTYNLRSWAGGMLFPWNCTEVYRQESDGVWKIVHNHWSTIRPMDFDWKGMR